MARIPLIDPEQRPDLAELIGRVTGARGGRLNNVYRMLLNSPPIAEPWLALISALHAQAGYDERTRELAIIRVAILNDVDYIRRVHEARYAPKVGITPEQVAALPSWQGSQLFSARDRALLAYVDKVTRDLEVPDDVFAALRAHFDERQVLELTVLIGAYNMHSRVMKALRIDPEPSL